MNTNDSGTSIGAFVGGLYAREGDIIYSAGRTKQFSRRMSNIWRILSDVTYPIVAYTTVILFSLSRGDNQLTSHSGPRIQSITVQGTMASEYHFSPESSPLAFQAFYDLHIEDMWLPFFCNTTNINTSRMEIHETGYAWRFIRLLSTQLWTDSV
jgi:lysophospholipid hydrolase